MNVEEMVIFKKLWKEGRQKSGYQVLTLLSFWFFDIHIIRVPYKGQVPWHVDHVQGKRHYRINLHFNSQGRVRYMDSGKTLTQWFKGFIVYFRPDLRMHMVKKGNVPLWGKFNTKPIYILSFGWVRSNK